MSISIRPAKDPSYLDLQAEVGVSKHIGGRAATNELLALCHVAEANVVLEIGCGIGAGLTNLARHCAGRIVGVDRSPGMIRWARRRAAGAGVADRVALAVADVRHLPFRDEAFDVALCESVLAFVPDKAAAIAEMVRVARVDGWVGANEGWLDEAAEPADVARAQAALGADLPSATGWQALWDGSGLRERQVSPRRVDPAVEIRGRIEWIGWRWMLPAWGRALRLLLTRPELRPVIKEQFGSGADVMAHMGYVLLAGRK